MRILLDHCVPKRLGRHHAGHAVSTTRQMQWETLQNGKLLAAAALQFDLLLTVDQGFEHQHNLATLPLSVAILVGPTNQLSDLVRLVPRLLIALQSLAPRTLVKVTGS
jgi:predicted nuclease of predicted toxin-antitoxin system